MPNYKYVPVAYHAAPRRCGPRAAVRRPNGQRKLQTEPAPDFGPCRNLDYEFELGVWVGPGNRAGRADPDGEARDISPASAC